MNYFRHLLILGLVAFLAAGCSGAVATSNDLPPESPENSGKPLASPTPSPGDPADISSGLPAEAAATNRRPDSTETYIEVPTDWQAGSPESRGLDSNILAEMFLSIEEQGTDLHSLLIWRDGVTVLEAYFYPHRVDRKHVMFSITKSFITTLTGITMEQGYIKSVDQKIVDLLPDTSFDNPDPRKDQITIEDVLTMTSGLGWEESDVTFGDLYYQEDWVKYVFSKPMIAEPGSNFSYCSGCSHILSAVIQATTGKDLLVFARESLFEPLAISDFYWETDRSGLPIGGWGLELTTRDMAKLGILYLNQGTWNGKQILPPEWIVSAVEYHADTGNGVGYGYQWWIYPEYGAYAAFGRGGQTVFVIPEQKLIIATTAETVNHDPILDLIDEFILPAVRSNQPLPQNPAGEKRLQDILDQIARP